MCVHYLIQLGELLRYVCACGYTNIILGKQNAMPTYGTHLEHVLDTYGVELVTGLLSPTPSLI